jgi:murein DD-endopeptidase MepM/ murein hydrolase activator NlpD
MKNISLIVSLSLFLSACMQDSKAPIEYKQGVFYGREGYYDQNGNELPKYNNNNRAELPAQQASKYVDDNTHQYGVSANVEQVQAAELPPPEPVKSADLAPIAPITAPAINATEPAVSKTAISPFDSKFDPNAIPVVKQSEEIEPNQALLPNFSKQAEDAKSAAKINWQKTKDNAESSYDAKMLQAESEQATLQQQADKELTQEEQKYAAINPELLPKELAKNNDTNPKITKPKITPPAVQPKYKVHSSLQKEKFVWPLKGNILKDYKTDASKGLVIAGRTGEPVRASSNGSVVFVGEKIKSLGKMVIIQHPDGYVTTYSHLNDMVVSENDNVVAGQLIGFVGKTGSAEQPQLHFAVRHNTKPVDPIAKLGK